MVSKSGIMHFQPKFLSLINSPKNANLKASFVKVKHSCKLGKVVLHLHYFVKLIMFRMIIMFVKLMIMFSALTDFYEIFIFNAVFYSNKIVILPPLSATRSYDLTFFVVGMIIPFSQYCLGSIYLSLLFTFLTRELWKLCSTSSTKFTLQTRSAVSFSKKGLMCI